MFCSAAKKTSPEEAPSSGDIPAKGEASAEDSDLKDKAEVIKSSDNLVVLFCEYTVTVTLHTTGFLNG